MITVDVFDVSDNELVDIVNLFFDTLPSRIKTINTSHGNADFRETLIVEWANGEKYVIKLSDNDFTSVEKIYIWKRSGKDHRKLGYYCPSIIEAKNGGFPAVTYKGHSCVVYVEEYSKYTSLKDLTEGENSDDFNNGRVAVGYGLPCIGA